MRAYVQAGGRDDVGCARGHFVQATAHLRKPFPFLPRFAKWRRWEEASCEFVDGRMTSLRSCSDEPWQSKSRRTVEVPQLQFIDRLVNTTVACSVRKARCTLCMLLEISLVQFLVWPVVVLRQGLSSRQCRIPSRFCSSWTRLTFPSLLRPMPMARQRRTPVEIPQVPFLDKLFMPVVVSGANGQTAQNTRGDSTGAVFGQVVHARCCVWCQWPDSAEHPWRFHRCRSWTSCSCTLLCLVRMSRQRRTPVEIPHWPFLDKLFMHVGVSGADGQTAQNTRGDSTGRRHPRRGAEVAPAELWRCSSSERVFLQSPRQPCSSRHPSLKFRQFDGVCPARSRCEVWDVRTRL